jgi:hypothetical protein
MNNAKFGILTAVLLLKIEAFWDAASHEQAGHS